jgi:hypothetical protein
MTLKTLKTISDFEQLEKGQAIFVSNGENEPPKHHTKKHKRWSLRNYKGFLHRFGFSAGRYEIVVDSTGSGVMVNAYGVGQLTFQIET